MKFEPLLVLAVIAVARSEKACKFYDGVEIVASDNFDCESYATARAESFRWNAIRNRIRDIIDRLFPTESPDDHEECPADGIKQISHPDSCEKYILCIGGAEVKRRCAPGLHFSREYRSCVTPEMADCKEFVRTWECPEEDDFGNLKLIPNTENCQKYYICLNGDQIPLSCADGFHWSIDDENCLPKKDANCDFEGEESEEDIIEHCPDDGIKSISHPDDCEKYVLCVNGARIKRNCAPGYHFSRDFRSCVLPEFADCKEGKLKCPKEDDLDNLVFLPDPDSCEKYYVCFGGDPVQLSCSGGLHWSADDEVCIDKHEAGCETFDDDIEECPDEGIKSISHPDNCEKYILCIGGARIKRNCAPGLHFSRELRNCVEPETAECKPTKLTCPEEDDLDNLVFLPNREDCSMFYVCFGGEAFPFSCSDGTHWSTRENLCLKKSEAKCEFDDDEGAEQCPETGIESISHPESCEKYILCVGGARIKRSCAPGFHFSRDFRSCVPADIADCNLEEGETLECPEIDDLDNLVFLPNSKICEKYYVCFGGEQVSLSCGDGLHWSVEEQNCVDKRTAGCEKFDDDFEECPDDGVKAISHPDNCEKYVLCVGGTRIKRNCAPGYHFSREARTCVAADIAGCKEIVECPESDDLDNLIFLPNPNYCHKYYFCFGGEAFPFACADGMHWSREHEICTSKELAGCEEYEGNDIEECPETGVKSISHPYNCEKYVLCVGGARIKRTCAPGFHFSREWRNCVPADIADCTDATYSCPEEDDLSNLVHLPNREDCGEFFVCFEGEKHPLACGSGLHWSVAEQTCTTKSKAMCDFEYFEQCPDDGIEHISHPESCEKYVICINGARIDRSCGPGLHFSRVLRSCVQQEMANCEI